MQCGKRFCLVITRYPPLGFVCFLVKEQVSGELCKRCRDTRRCGESQRTSAFARESSRRTAVPASSMESASSPVEMCFACGKGSRHGGLSGGAQDDAATLGRTCGKDTRTTPSMPCQPTHCSMSSVQAGAAAATFLQLVAGIKPEQCLDERKGRARGGEKKGVMGRQRKAGVHTLAQTRDAANV